MTEEEGEFFEPVYQLCSLGNFLNLSLWLRSSIDADKEAKMLARSRFSTDEP